MHWHIPVSQFELKLVLNKLKSVNIYAGYLLSFFFFFLVITRPHVQYRAFSTYCWVNWRQR